MILIESLDIDKESIEAVISKLKDISFDNEFDETINNINFYFTGDKEKTVFIQYKDGYATITKDEIYNTEESEIVENIKYQLDNTIE